MQDIDTAKTGEIILYTNPDGSTGVDVRLDKDTVWLDAHQMAQLFTTDRTSIVRHINNIYKSDELDTTTTCAKVAQVAADGKSRIMNIYNLDMIISVGYRVNSKKGIQFRLWANSVLKEHLIKGYSLNPHRLSNEQITQFQQALTLFPQAVERLSVRGELQSDEAVALMKLVTEYASSWALLQQYDDGQLEQTNSESTATFTLEYSRARQAIDTLRNNLIAKEEASDLFGNERDGSFQGVLGSIYQTFGGEELYPSIEHKAAHLLYFVIKDHPFSDGNKRIGSLLFIYFLQANNYLSRSTGEAKINDNALVALALLVAESDPKQKEMMIALIMHLLR
jgi:prophage maintenance system killer protein